MSRSQRLSWNFVAVASGKAILSLRHLILVPFFLNVWGAATYGEWLLVTSIPTFLSLSSLGLGQAARTQIVLDLSDGRKEKAYGMAIGSMIFMGIFFSLALSITLILSSHIFSGVNRDHIQDPSLVFVYLMAGVALTNVVFPLQGYWIAGERAAIQQLWNSTLEVFLLVGMLLVLIFQGNPKIMATVSFVITTVWTMTFSVVSLRGVQHYPLKWSNLSPCLPMIRKGLGFQLSNLWQAILFQGFIWAAHRFLGEFGAALWGTIRTLGRSGCQLLSMIGHTIEPELQLSIGHQQFNTARRLLSFQLVLSILISLIFSIAMMAAGPWIYEIWTGGKLTSPYLVWPLMALAMVFNSLWSTSANVHTAFNQPWGLNAWGLMSAIGGLGMAMLLYIFMPNLGIFTFAIGHVFFEFLMTLYVLKTALKLLDDNLANCLYRGIDIIKSKILGTFSR